MADASAAHWRPNKWAAAVLAFLAPPFAMLYVNRPRLAGIYFLVLLALALTMFWLAGTGRVSSISPGPLSIVIAAVVVPHAYWLAIHAPETGSRPWFGRWYGLLTIALVAFLAAASFRAFVFEPFRTPSQSMFPSIPKGSYILVRKYGYGSYVSFGVRLFRLKISAPLNRGDVVAFEFPRDRNTALIERLIGLPGDHIEYRDKHLSVNGEALPTNPIRIDHALDIVQEAGYQIANQRDRPAQDFDVQVEPGHLFLLGDNRDNSNDSRYWGQVPFDHVIGKVVLVLKNEKTESIDPASSQNVVERNP